MEGFAERSWCSQVAEAARGSWANGQPWMMRHLLTSKPTAIGAVLLKDTRPCPPGLQLWHKVSMLIRTAVLGRLVALPLGPQHKPYLQCSSIGTDESQLGAPRSRPFPQAQSLEAGLREMGW